MKQILLIILLFFTTYLKASNQCDTTFKNINLNKTSNQTKGTAQIRFAKKIDNYPKSGQQIWFYEIKSGTQYTISHTIFGFSNCLNIKQIGTWFTYDSSTFHKWSNVSYSNDPTTQKWGYKFDSLFNDNETKKYYLVVDKIYATSQIEITLKGGTKYNSNYVCGPDCEALPITLINSNIYSINDSDIITWEIVNETNIDYYSIDLIGNTVFNIGKIYANNIASLQEYIFKYKTPSMFNYIYKITPIDNNGEYLFPIYLSINNKEIDKFYNPGQPYPNPTSNYIIIPGELGKNVMILDSSGYLVYNGILLNNKLSINFNSGTYYLFYNGRHTKFIVY